MRILLMALALIAFAFLINVASDLSIASPRDADGAGTPASVEVPPALSRLATPAAEARIVSPARVRPALVRPVAARPALERQAGVDPKADWRKVRAARAPKPERGKPGGAGKGRGGGETIRPETAS